jgi:hypothetical protein
MKLFRFSLPQPKLSLSSTCGDIPKMDIGLTDQPFYFELRGKISSLPKATLTSRAPSRSSSLSIIVQFRVGFGCMVELHALANAFARAHLSSASASRKVPNPIFVLNLNYYSFKRSGMLDK